MKVTKELLEKYHRNECNQREIDLVEDWLFSDESDFTLDLPSPAHKAVQKAEIWNSIESSMGDEGVPTPLNPKLLHRNSFWLGAVAASLVFAILGSLIYFQSAPTPDTEIPNLFVNKTRNLKHIDAGPYNISIGPNTSARINNTTGVVDLSGSLLISPKEDLEFTFGGETGKIRFKAGQTYIVLKGSDGNDKIIIVNERNILDLPPVLQKHIINEFKI